VTKLTNYKGKIYLQKKHKKTLTFSEASKLERILPKIDTSNKYSKRSQKLNENNKKKYNKGNPTRVKICTQKMFPNSFSPSLSCWEVKGKNEKLT